MPEAKILRYAGPASGKGYEWWREDFGRQVLDCDIVPLGDNAIDVQYTSLQLAGVNLVSGEGTTANFITLGRSDELVLLLPTEAKLLVAVNGRATPVESGTMSVADAGQAGSSVARVSPGLYHTAFFDRKTILDLCPRAEDFLARQIVGKDALFSLFCRYYESVQGTAAELDPQALHIANQHLLDLAALILGGRPDAVDAARDRGLAAARLQVIKADILAGLSDPNLSIGGIAQRHRASVRYVQLLFEREGSTFIDFIVEQRLLQAHRMLCHPRHGTRKIADIAQLAGFNNLSNFNRAYRRRFGETPSDTRDRASRAAPSD